MTHLPEFTAQAYLQATEAEDTERFKATASIIVRASALKTGLQAKIPVKCRHGLVSLNVEC